MSYVTPDHWVVVVEVVDVDVLVVVVVEDVVVVSETSDYDPWATRTTEWYKPDCGVRENE